MDQEKVRAYAAQFATGKTIGEIIGDHAAAEALGELSSADVNDLASPETELSRADVQALARIGRHDVIEKARTENRIRYEPKDAA